MVGESVAGAHDLEPVRRVLASECFADGRLPDAVLGFMKKQSTNACYLGIPGVDGVSARIDFEQEQGGLLVTGVEFSVEGLGDGPTMVANLAKLAPRILSMSSGNPGATAIAQRLFEITLGNRLTNPDSEQWQASGLLGVILDQLVDRMIIGDYGFRDTRENLKLIAALAKNGRLSGDVSSWQIFKGARKV